MAPYSTYTEQELVALLKQGDHAAFSEIFERYHALLYIFAYKKINDREEAKDQVHELFTALWEKHEELNMSGLILPYLYTVLKNRIFDLYKHKKISQRYLDTFQERNWNNIFRAFQGIGRMGPTGSGKRRARFNGW